MLSSLRQRRGLTFLTLLVGLAHQQLWGLAQAEPAALRQRPGPVLVRMVDATARPADRMAAAASIDPATNLSNDTGPAPTPQRARTRTAPPQPQTQPAAARVAPLAPASDDAPLPRSASTSVSTSTQAPSAEPVDTVQTEPEPSLAVPAMPDMPAPSLAQLTTRGQRPEGRSSPAAAQVATPAAAPSRTDALPAPPIRPPASVTLRYSLRRGALAGDGELTWRSDGRAYSLDLVARLPILGTIFEQHSRGLFDAAGLAPVRYTEKRIAKSERAVNIVRPDDGSPSYVAFSARSGRLALPVGLQDRVSWMVQLAARLQAWPGELQLGQRIEMPVAGPNGDVQAWHFLVKDSVTGADGERQWRLLREADQPYETQAEVWVSPQRGYFPARVRLTENQGDPLELTLK